MTIDRAIAIALIVITAGAYQMAKSFPDGGDLFPQVISGAILLMAVGLLFTGGRKTAAEKQGKRISEAKSYVTLLLTLLYVVGITTLGFFTSTGLFLVILMYLMGIRGVGSYATVLASVIVLYYLAFARVLHVPFPQGILF